MKKCEWITDRVPTVEDSQRGYVWTTFNDGEVHVWPYRWEYITLGMPWMPLQFPQPYVKPKRYKVDKNWSGYTVYDTVTQQLFADHIGSQDAADRIAAIYEEVEE